MKTSATNSSFVRKVCALTLASLLTQFVWANAGDVISINFYQAEVQKVAAAQTTVAGTIPAEAWYNVAVAREGNTTTGTNLNSYNPKTQASTQTTVSYSQYFSERNIRQTPDLISDAAYSYLKAALTTQMADYQGTAKVDLTTIPYVKYDVVLYFFVSASNNTAKNDGQQTAFHVSTTGTADGDYAQYTVGEDGVPTEGTAAWGRGSDRTFVLGQNTAVFSGLTSRAFHFKHQSANSGLCAIQIIDRSDAQPVKKTMNINFCQDGQKGAVTEQQLTALGMVPTSAWKNTSQGAQAARSPVSDAETGGCLIENLLVWDGVNDAQADATKKVRFGVQQMNNLWIDTTANTTLTNALDYLSSGLCHKVGDNFEANIYVTNDGEDFEMYDVIVYLTAANVNNKIVQNFSAIQINDQWYKGDLTVEDTKTAACDETDTWGETPVTSLNGGCLGKTAIRVNGLSGTLHIKKAAQTDCGIAAIQIVEAEAPKAVAQIGTTLYPSLAAAVGDAEDAQTITIIGDVSSEKVAIENKVIYISGAINGRNVDCECEVPMKNGDMLFGDLEMAVAEVTSKGYSPFVVDKSVLFKMHKGVKIESDIVLPPYANTNSAIYFDATYCGMDEQTLDLNGHTISQTQGGPGGYWWSSVHVNCATVRIVDTSKEQTGKITGIGSCITITGYDEYQGYSFPAQVTLESGTLTVTGKPQKSGSNTYYAENGIVGIFYSGKFIMTGGKIDAVMDLDPDGKVAGVIADGANTTYGKPSVTITGGEIIGVPLDHQIARKPGIPLSTDGIFAGAIVSEKTIKISGGTFSSPLNLDYCADDCYPTVINGVYGVCTNPVAKIGDMYYTTLQAAADAAENGDTIELLAEAHLEGLSVFGKAVIIVHTKTVSGTTQYFLKLGSAYIGEQKDSGAIPLLNSVDVPGGDKISPAVDAECVTKYTYSSGDHTWKQPIVVGDLTKCVAIATGSEYIPTTTKKPYLISYFISKNITLEDDMELPLRTTISGSLNFCGDNLVFDLNGRTLKQGVYVNGYPAVAVKAGSLTIKDSVGNGQIIGATNGLNVENGAQCVVESGSIMTMGCWNEKVHGSCVIAQNDAELTIKGGVFGDDSFYVDNPKTDGTLWAMNATVSITGGEFRAPTNEKAWDGTAICAYSYTAGKTASVTISGDPVVYGWVYPYQAAGSAAMSISGGQFDMPVNKYYGKLTVDGYDVVINENGLYEPLPKTPDLEITVSEDGQTITPLVTSEGTVVVVNQDTLEKTEVIPQETGLYGVIVKNVAGKATETSLIGVIKVEEKATKKNTIAVAVPFTGATVENLLNTKLLDEGDELMAYVGGSYSSWSLTADKKWAPMLKARDGALPESGVEADKTTLKRGTAVWVTTAGQVVTLGSYNAETEIASAEESVNLLANPTMEELTVPVTEEIALGDQIVPTGSGDERYTVKKDGDTLVWECNTTTHTTIDGEVFDAEKIERKAPKIPVGKGYWMLKKPENK